MAKKDYKIAVVGATGLVGKELVEALSYRNFPANEIKAFASFNTAGETFSWRDEEDNVIPLGADSFEGHDVIFFATHPLVSRDLAEDAARTGAVVIDSSSAFRLDPEVPLVVPEVNPHTLEEIWEREKKIVAGPSAAAVAISLVAAPLHKSFGVKQINAVTAYGSTASGQAGFEEHQYQTISIFNQEQITIEKFERQTAFNVFPRVGAFDATGDSELEKELKLELPKILEAEIPVMVTAIQVPVFCGVGVALFLELSQKSSKEKVQQTLADAPGITIMDDPESGQYPDTILAMEDENVLVGRVRQDPNNQNLFALWVSADNLRKGSALNMVQIAELLIKLRS